MYNIRFAVRLTVTFFISAACIVIFALLSADYRLGVGGIYENHSEQTPNKEYGALHNLGPKALSILGPKALSIYVSVKARKNCHATQKGKTCHYFSYRFIIPNI